MKRVISIDFRFQAVTVTTILFMAMNALSPLNLSLQVEATMYPFRLSIATGKTTFQPGEPVNLTWILTNIGDEKITLCNSRDDPPDFLVCDENFVYVFRFRSYAGVIQMIYYFEPIAPGNSMIIMEAWEQVFDGSGNVYPELRLRSVPPGTYYVVGIFSSATYHIVIKTPAIKITIL